MQRTGSNIADKVHTHQTEVNAAADPRALSPETQDGKKTKIQNLLERRTF